MAKSADTSHDNPIAHRMKEHGHNVASFAEATGIAYNTLKRRLRNPDKLTLAELSAIAEALHTDPMTLLSETAPMAVTA